MREIAWCTEEPSVYRLTNTLLVFAFDHHINDEVRIFLCLISLDYAAGTFEFFDLIDLHEQYRIETEFFSEMKIDQHCEQLKFEMNFIGKFRGIFKK